MRNLVYYAAVPIPVFLAETDVLFCAGVAHALEAQKEFVLRQPALRDQESLEAAILGESGSIALASDALVRNLAHLARLTMERQAALVLLTTRQQTFEFPELPAVRGTLRRNVDARQLLACLEAIAAGKAWCTPPPGAAGRQTTGARVLAKLSTRQIKVMSGVSRGAKNVEIARELGTSEQVVKNMLGGIYDLAGVSDRLELALFVLHHPELAEAARSAAGLPEAERTA